MLQKLRHRVLSVVARMPVLQDMVLAAHDLRHRDMPWMLPHPFDQENGTDTRGFVPPWLLPTGQDADQHSTCYAGCQPSCVRAALSAIPAPDQTSFIDLGCGKGRALIIATEFRFRQVIGVELSPRLARTAQKNIEIVARAHPGRTGIAVAVGDASTAKLPDGDVAVFLYHPFGRELVGKIVQRLADSGAGRETFFIYANPVHGDLLDADPAFQRFFARTVACDPSELGKGSDDNETVVIWRRGGEARRGEDDPEANRPIVVTSPGWRAELAPRAR